MMVKGGPPHSRVWELTLWLDQLFPEWRQAFSSALGNSVTSAQDPTVYVQMLIQQYPNDFSEDSSSFIRGVEAHFVLKVQQQSSIKLTVCRMHICMGCKAFCAKCLWSSITEKTKISFSC